MNTKGFWASIDPGLGGTGVCIWYQSEAVPIKVYSIKCSTQKDYMHRIRYILIEHQITSVLIEEATYFSGSLVGQVSTTSGAIFKLSRFIGALEMLCDTYHIEHDLVLPVQWKGQLDKKNTERKIREILPNIEIKAGHDHAFDSVGIGLNLLGKF